MSNSLINSTTQIDATLTKDGYAADAKVVGDKLNNKLSKIVLKSILINMTTDINAQIVISSPSDAITLLGIYDYRYIFIPQQISGHGGACEFRCIKNISLTDMSQLQFARNESVQGRLWIYLTLDV